MIAWDDVSGATSYTLTELTFGTTRTNVTSPYIWNNLDNGEVYEFQLIAVFPDGDNAYSAEIEKMPLSATASTDTDVELDTTYYYRVCPRSIPVS